MLIDLMIMARDVRVSLSLSSSPCSIELFPLPFFFFFFVLFLSLSLSLCLSVSLPTHILPLPWGIDRSWVSESICWLLRASSLVSGHRERQLGHHLDLHHARHTYVFHECHLVRFFLTVSTL
jgi:hypothetical protein